MTHFRNADLTLGHIKSLSDKCKYELIDPTPGRDLVCKVLTPSGEIVEFRSLLDARRFLVKDLKETLAERKRECQKLGIKIAIATLPYYYEHILEVPPKYLGKAGAATYFRIGSTSEYTVLDHRVENIQGTGVLIFWTPFELSAYSQQCIDHDWREATRSIYNLEHNQSLAAFQAWYDALDEQTQLDYWTKRLAEMEEQQELGVLKCADETRCVGDTRNVPATWMRSQPTEILKDFFPNKGDQG